MNSNRTITSATLLISPLLPLDALIANCSQKEREEVSGLCTKRVAEILTWHKVVGDIYPNAHFSYDAFHGPKIDVEGVHIGVSHCKDMVAVIIANEKCAVDIERLDHNFEHLTPHYLSQAEIENRQFSPLFCAIAWCAKECAYKYYRKGNISYTKDIEIQSFNQSKRTVSLRIFNNKYIFFYEITPTRHLIVSTHQNI